MLERIGRCWAKPWRPVLDCSATSSGPENTGRALIEAGFTHRADGGADGDDDEWAQRVADRRCGPSLLPRSTETLEAAKAIDFLFAGRDKPSSVLSAIPAAARG